MENKTKQDKIYSKRSEVMDLFCNHLCMSLECILFATGHITKLEERDLGSQSSEPVGNMFMLE